MKPRQVVTQSARITISVIGTCRHRHRSTEFRRFLDRIDAAVHSDLDVHLNLDNYTTHKTPTSTSWLNLVERWFATPTEKQLRRGFTPSGIVGSVPLSLWGDGKFLASIPCPTIPYRSKNL